jgi:aspartyl protease
MTAKNRRPFVLVPLKREKSHHITVEARLAGRPARFIVDTGAGGTIIDLSAAAEFKLKLRPHSKKGGWRRINSNAHELSCKACSISGRPRLIQDETVDNGFVPRQRGT